MTDAPLSEHGQSLFATGFACEHTAALIRLAAWVDPPKGSRQGAERTLVADLVFEMDVARKLVRLLQECIKAGTGAAH